MSAIKRELQFQLLLLHGTFSTAYCAAYNVAHPPYCDFVYDDAYSTVYNSVSGATSYAASIASCSIASIAAGNAAYKVVSSATYSSTKKVLDGYFDAYKVVSSDTYSGNKKIFEGYFDAIMLAGFKEALKMDSKIQEDIKTKAMTTKGEIPVNRMPKAPKTDLELITSLLKVNISKMTPIIQVYWIAVSVVYIIWC